MGLTAQEITNSKAGQYDVELMFYGGPYYNALTLSDYPEGDTSPDTTGFTDVTSRVSGAGAFTYGRSGNSLRSSATLNGTQYDAAYFGPGRAILCLRRILINGVQVVPGTGTWELWWLGQINSGAHMDDYQHGGAWSRNLGGLDTQFQRRNAPRLTAGRIDMLSGVSPTASSILETVALEADSGEFAGVLANVAASNTTDGNLNTLWMSSGVPTLTPQPNPDGVVRKVYREPLAGYDQTKLWWIQFESNLTHNTYGWIIKNQAGVSVWVPFDDCSGTDNILVANKPAFEAYFGSQFEVDNIVDVRTLFQGTGDYSSYPTDNAPFTLNPDTGWIQMCDAYNGAVIAAVAWNQTGANVTISGWNGGSASPAINVSGMAPGTGLLHDDNGGNTAGDWSGVLNLSPGAGYDDTDDEAIEWLSYELEAQTAALDGSCSNGATTITLTSTLGLLDAGTAICAGSDTFTYTGRTNTTLTGVSGITSHASGSSIRQVIGGVAQTGWPCSRFELLRPNNPALPRIAAGRVYFSDAADITNPGEANWELDWDPSFIRLGQPVENDGVYDYGATITAPDGGPRWVRCMLVIFDEMTGGGTERARLNEAKVYLSQTQVNGSEAADIGSIKASGLASYIFDQAGATTYLADGTSTDFGPWIGEHATGIAPFPQVLDDLARITGCVMDWGVAGIATWWPDMWWPANYVSSQFAARADLDAAYLRGQAQFAGLQPVAGGVRVHARTPDGLHQYEATFPTGLADSVLLIEFDDLVTTSPELANDLAQTLYYQAGLRYTTGPQQLTFVLKGPGEWLRPEQYIRLACDTADSGQIEVYDSGSSWTGWLVESVTWEWGRAEAFRTWLATVSCRKYWRGTYTI